MRPSPLARTNAHIPVDTDRIVGRSRLLGEMRDLLRRKHYSIRTGESAVGRAVKQAVIAAALPKHGSRHTLRPQLCHPLLEDGYDIRTVQKLLGHRDVRTTMIYTHVMNKGPMGVKSPLSRLSGF